MTSISRSGCLLLFLGMVCGCARHVAMPPEQLDQQNWHQWSIRPIPPTVTQAEADAQTNRPMATVAPPQNAPAVMPTSPGDNHGADQVGTPLPSASPPATAFAPPPPLMTGGWEKARLDELAREQKLDAARQSWHLLLGLHVGITKRLKSSDDAIILDGGFHLGLRKYLSPKMGIELRLALDRGVVLVPKCNENLETCYGGEEDETDAATYLTRISGEVGMPSRIGGNFVFVPSFWFGRESYDDKEKKVGRTTWMFDYKSTLRGGPGARLAWSFADDRFDLGTTMRLSLLGGMYFFSWSILELSAVF